MGYTKHIEYQFKAEEIHLAVSETWQHEHLLCCEVIDTRRNGQEDTHMSGMLVMENGLWEWDDTEDGHMFEEYESKELMDAIPKYLNDNKHPDLIGKDL